MPVLPRRLSFAVVLSAALLGTLALGSPAATAAPGGDGRLVPVAGDRPVALELVIAMDVSTSVDPHEYRLQRDGIADALRAPEVQAAIAAQAGGIAVTVIEWSAAGRQSTIAPWRHVAYARDALALAALLDREGSPATRGWTAIGDAIAFSIRLFEGNGFRGDRRVIDISGDGQETDGDKPGWARDAAAALGIAVNGLPILTDQPDLDLYYAQHVIGGPNAFLEVAENFEAFAVAMKRKLRREISGDRYAEALLDGVHPPLAGSAAAPQLACAAHPAHPCGGAL